MKIFQSDQAPDEHDTEEVDDTNQLLNIVNIVDGDSDADEVRTH